MRRPLCLFALALLLAVPLAHAAEPAAEADPPCAAATMTAAGIDLAALVAAPGLSPAPGLAPAPEPAAVLADCTATAYCYPGTVTCSASGPEADCDAVDSNCPAYSGWVTCTGSGGTTTNYCPSCPQPCVISCLNQPNPSFCPGKCQIVCKADGGYCNQTTKKCVCLEI
jgi:hypothetical protein